MIKSMIGGLQLQNSVGNDNSVQVNTSIVNGTLKHLITIGDNNYLKFVCVTTLITNPTLAANNYTAIIEYKTIALNAQSTMS